MPGSGASQIMFNHQTLEILGTNFYRIPRREELSTAKEKLKKMIDRIDINCPDQVKNHFRIEIDIDHLGFYSFDHYSPWDIFVENISVHIGKRSSGWKFSWNHNNWKYYDGKETLLSFIREGRVVDEYGMEIEPDEFIEMAHNWCPDGLDSMSYYAKLREEGKNPLYPDHYVDIIRDDLRFMNTTEFS